MMQDPPAAAGTSWGAGLAGPVSLETNINTMRSLSALQRADLSFREPRLELAFNQTEQRRWRQRTLGVETLRSCTWAVVAWGARRSAFAGPLLVGALSSAAVLALHAKRGVAPRCASKGCAGLRCVGADGGAAAPRPSFTPPHPNHGSSSNPCNPCTPPPCSCRSQYAAVVAAHLLQCAVAILCACGGASFALLQAAPAAVGTLATRLHSVAVVCSCTFQVFHLAWSSPLPFRCGGAVQRGPEWT